SNGTRVNGRPVNKPKKLKAGDVVEFGDVEFVFTEGDAKVDVNAYRGGGGGSNLALFGGLAALVLVGLALGGLLVYGILSYGDGEESDSAEASVEARTEKLVEQGRSELERDEWNNAIATFDEVLALDPEDEEANELRSRARREREAAEMLERGEDLTEQGRHEEAHQTLRDVPEETSAHRRAERTLEHVEKSLAHKLANEARRLVRRDSPSDEDLLEAYKKLERSTDLVANKEIEEYLDELRERLDDRGLDYESAER
ncbi:MAG: FHA domain-containing protein, partial [Persicimonas sp.]